MERSPHTISLYVTDVVAAIAFYVDNLSFRQTGSWSEEGASPIWAEVARDGPKGTARIWFFSHQIETRPGPILSGLIYLFVDDVDAEADRLRDRVAFQWGPENQEYGLRELGIEDLNSYLLCFAQDV